MTESATPAIDARAVTKVYPEGRIGALNGFSLRVAAGEMTAIMGASGSGKSTLLNLVAALDRPTSGEILVFGEPLDGRRDLALYRAREIGIVFQSFNLFPALTAVENVLVPMFEGALAPGRRRERARELLDFFGLDGCANQRVGALSQGQQQRVAIARSLANEPRLLLADEPTGNLDSASARQAMDYIGRIHAERGLTVLLVTHDPAIALRAQRVVQIADGRNVPDAPVGRRAEDHP